MSRKKYNIKTSIFTFLITMLLLVTLFSMHLVANVYAKYRTTVNNSDEARVALFNITQEGTIFNTIEASVAPNTPQSVELIIKNKSEVAVEYNLTITNTTSNIKPLKYRLNAQGTSPVATTEIGENGESIFKTRQIPGEYIDKYLLEIYWETSENQEDDLAYMGMVDYITIAVAVIQIH